MNRSPRLLFFTWSTNVGLQSCVITKRNDDDDDDYMWDRELIEIEFF